MSSGVKTCYYEVLGVERNVSVDDIKKAFKKAALRWHPDKNLDNSEEAAEKFKEIQNAYSILSDPQERAWYDAHRESILRGDNADEDDSEDPGVNLWPYFSSSCFTSYNVSDEKNFYKVYGDLFAQLDLEEEQSETTDVYHHSFPPFGDANSDWASIRKFYSEWSDFVSHRSYAWADKYRVTTAPNRQVKRAMEKENKKERDKARKARSEQIRHLVQTVRKRDKRIIEHTQRQERERKEQELKDKDQKQKRQAEAAKQRAQLEADRQRMFENSEMAEALDALIEETAERFGVSSPARNESDNENDSLDSDVEQEQQPQELFCAVCRKKFKSAKQWSNHERSKSHLQKLQQLRSELLLDDEQLPMPDTSMATDMTPPTASSKKKKKKARRKAMQSSYDDQDESEQLDEDSLQQEDSNNTNNNNNNNNNNNSHDDDDELTEHTEQDTQQVKAVDTPLSHQQQKKQKKKNKNKATNEKTTPPNQCAQCNEVFPSRNKLMQHLQTSGHATYLPRK